MSTEVTATVLLPKPRSLVRQHLIGRWTKPDMTGVVAARVVAGAEAHSGPARTILPAFDAAVTNGDAATGTNDEQAFEVEAHGVLWRYTLQALDERTTRVQMAWVQANWVGKLPGIRAFMTKGIERERTRLERWASTGAE